MNEYVFCLKYRLPDADCDADELVERLGQVGCTDALIGIGITGRLALDFIREAESARAAMRSALEEVRAAIPQADLIEALPDYVGLSDVAHLLDVSRQTMRKLMLANSDFPLPVHEGSASIWHLAEVLGWFGGRKNYTLDPILRETAMMALEINLAKETHRNESQSMHELKPLVA